MASRGVRGWVAPSLAFLSAVVVALLGIATNIATNLLPPSWAWLGDPVLMWLLVAVLIFLAAVLAARMVPRGSHERLPEDVEPAGESPSIGSVTAGSGTTIIGGTIVGGVGSTIPKLAPSMPVSNSAALVVHGEIPAQPVAWQFREEVDKLIAAVLERTGVTVVSATGQRGVGKSQAAAAVARHMVALGWELVVWVSGETEQAMVAGLEPVARELGVDDPDGDSYRSVERLRDHLRTRTKPGLIVIDNAEDAAQLRRWLPGVGATRVVVTSTDQTMSALGETVEIGTYTRERSVDFLQTRTGLVDLVGADRVANELGDLPLALAQAASAVLLRDRTYQNYLARLAATDVATSLIRRNDDPYPRGAAEAILLSLQAVEPSAHHAATNTVRRVLEVVALLDPAGVERDLVALLLLDLPTTGEVAAESVEAAIERAVLVSVLTWARVGGQSVVMHRLVARVVRERAAHDEALHPTMRRVIGGLQQQLVVPDGGRWQRRTRFDQAAGHVRSLWGHLYNNSLRGAHDAEVARVGASLLATAVSYLNATAQHRAAIALGEEAYPQINWVLGLDHPETLSAANTLAYAYRSAGYLDQARQLYEDTLRRRRRTLGKDEPSTLVSANNLAYAFVLVGRLDEAIWLYEDTRDRYRRVSGDDDLDTVLAESNLAYAYARAGRLDEAIKLYQKTRDRYRRAFGDDHVDTLRAAHNLAIAYKRAKRLTEALTLLRNTVAGYRRALGKDHPDTLRAAHNLANAYTVTERRNAAVALLNDTLARSRRVLGYDHPETLALLQTLNTTNGREHRPRT